MRIAGLSKKIIKALLLTQYANMLEYRVEIALWALSGVLPLIMFSLWANNEAGSTFGFSEIDLARYFLSAFLVRQFSVVWVVFSFEEDSLLGKLSPYLLQPLHPLWRYFSAHIAEQVTRLPFAILICSVFFMLNPYSFWVPSIFKFLLGWLSTFLAFSIAFLLQSLIASFCFWSEKASALERLIFIPYLFFSGLLAPLSAFPSSVLQFAYWTPFPYLINFPAKILCGLPVDLLQGLLIQICWIILLLPLVLIFWRAGVRHYTAMGA
tara:strand:- start:216 stop:1013 length:798 start_codon:yes stop_codon:yes gene_type:complete